MSKFDKYMTPNPANEAQMISTQFSCWLQAVTEMETQHTIEAQDDLVWYVEHFDTFRKIAEKQERFEDAALYRDLIGLANPYIKWDALAE